MDERAFEQRVLELEPRLYRTACAILWNDADAADALQECLLKAWRKRARSRRRRALTAGSPVSSSTSAIPCDTGFAATKRSASTRPSAMCRPGEPVDLGLRDALRAVPEHLRLPLLLHHMEGYSLQEVGGYAAHIRSRRAGQGIPGQTEAAPAAG